MSKYDFRKNVCICDSSGNKLDSHVMLTNEQYLKICDYKIKGELRLKIMSKDNKREYHSYCITLFKQGIVAIERLITSLESIKYGDCDLHDISSLEEELNLSKVVLNYHKDAFNQLTKLEREY